MSELSSTEIAIQNRKFAKTCVEKKRRDRINRCLDELKDIMSQTDDKARYQKMEKAEILEMAVSYMKNMRNNNKNNNSTNLTQTNDLNNSQTNEINQNYYTMAFQQCLTEFQNFLNVFPGVKEDFKSRLMSYMSQRYIELVNVSQQNSNYSNSSQTEYSSRKLKQSRYSPYNVNQRNTPKKFNNKIEDNSLSSANEQMNNLYQQNSKFGGSCSSLDSFNVQQNSEFESDNTYEVHNRSNLSTNSSPALSECSSPVSNGKKSDCENTSSNSTSSLNFSNFELYQNCYMKVWRPW